MHDQIRPNPDHPFHAYVRARDLEQETRAYVEQQRIELLMRESGRIYAISWTVSRKDAARNSPSVDDIVLELDDRSRLCLGNHALLGHLEFDDWRGVSFAGTPLKSLISRRAETEGLDTRTAAVDTLSALTGIPPTCIEPFFWLVHEHVLAHIHDREDTLYLAPSLLPS